MKLEKNPSAKRIAKFLKIDKAFLQQHHEAKGMLKKIFTILYRMYDGDLQIIQQWFGDTHRLMFLDGKTARVVFYQSPRRLKNYLQQIEAGVCL